MLPLLLSPQAAYTWMDRQASIGVARFTYETTPAARLMPPRGRAGGAGGGGCCKVPFQHTIMWAYCMLR